MSNRPDLAHLAAGVILAIAACVLSAIHTAVPTFIPFAALTLLGVAAGLSIPSGNTVANPVVVDPQVIPAAAVSSSSSVAPAKPQVALPAPTPPVAAPLAPAPAEPLAPAVP